MPLNESVAEDTAELVAVTTPSKGGLDTSILTTPSRGAPAATVTEAMDEWLAGINIDLFNTELVVDERPLSPDFSSDEDELWKTMRHHEDELLRQLSPPPPPTRATPRALLRQLSPPPTPTRATPRALLRQLSPPPTPTRATPRLLRQLSPPPPPPEL